MLASMSSPWGTVWALLFLLRQVWKHAEHLQGSAPEASKTPPARPAFHEDGQRMAPPQPIPEHLQGKAPLFPKPSMISLKAKECYDDML